MQAITLPLGIGHLPPHPCKVDVSPIPEHFLGIDILAGMCLQTTMGEFHLQMQVVKAVLRGHARHNPVSLPTPHRKVATKQYYLPGGHRRLGRP